MGASSSKRAFFWQKKSPVERAWSRLKGALPVKKRRRKSLLERLRPGNSKNKKFKRFFLADKKEPETFKRFSVGNIKKGVRESGGKEDRKGKEEKTLRNGGAPPHQVVKKTDKPENKRPKVPWKSQ